MTKNFTVSVVIPTEKTDSNIDEILKSILSQDFDMKEIEVIVINNLDDFFRDGLEQKWRDQFGNFIYRSSGLKSINVARNIGLSLSHGNVIWFLEERCRLTNTQVIKNLIDLHRNKPNVLAIGGDLSFSKRLNIFERAYVNIIKRDFDFQIKNEGIKQFIGCNTSFKKDLKKHFIKFDDYTDCGDTEYGLSYKIHQKNLKLFLTKSLVVEYDLSLNLLQYLKKGSMQGKGQRLNSEFYNKGLRSPKANSFLEELYYLFLNIAYDDDYIKIKIREFRNLKGYFRNKISHLYRMIKLRLKTGISNKLFTMKAFYHSSKLKLIKIYYKSRHFINYCVLDILKIPFIKLYFMMKYHVETYLLPIFRKLNPRGK